MALSGQTASVGLWDNTHLYYIDWTATQSIANNTSSVTARIRVRLLYNAGTWWSGYATLPWTIVVDGQSQSGNLQTNLTLAAGATYTLAERTFTVTHGTDGAKSFSISGSTATPGGGGTVYPSGGPWTLDTIPRKTTITSVGNITTASTSIAVTLDRKHSTYTHSINLKLGSTSIATWTGTAANNTGAFTLAITAAQRTAMLQLMPSSTSATGTLTVTTLSGATTIGSDSKTLTISVHSGAVPTLASITTTVSTTYQITGTTKAVMAQIVGTLSFSVPWVMATGATLATRNTTFSGNANTNATGSFTSSTSGTKAITSTATDSRGRTGTSTKNITVLPYTPVVLEVGYIGRDPTDNTKLKVDTYQTVYNFNSENKYRLTIETRPKGGSWTTVHTVNYTGGTSRVARSYTPATDYTTTSSYDVRITLMDELTTASVVGTLGTSGLTLVLGKTGVGFGKLPVADRSIDAAGDIWDRDGRNLSAGALVYQGNPAQDTDANTLGTGFYYITQHTTPTAFNFPASYGTLACFVTPYGFRFQIFVLATSTVMYVRSATSQTTWNAWKYVTLA